MSIIEVVIIGYIVNSGLLLNDLLLSMLLLYLYPILDRNYDKKMGHNDNTNLLKVLTELKTDVNYISSSVLMAIPFAYGYRSFKILLITALEFYKISVDNRQENSSIANIYIKALISTYSLILDNLKELNAR
jgi:hypothetical protein